MSSRSSSPGPDPLSDVLDVLGARVTRRTRLEAGGAWAFAFPAVDRLKFVALLQGAKWMLLPGRAPQRMVAGDVCVLGCTPYTVASDPGLAPADGAAMFAASGRDTVCVGGSETVGVGGSVTFSGANASFLLAMLPDFMLVSGSAPASGAIAAVLALMAREGDGETLGGDVVGHRLADVLLVEAIRIYAAGAARDGTGWLGALADPRMGRALHAIHRDIAHPWTVATLADVAGMSRAAFAAAFAARVGQSPLAYVRTWRLTVARAALMRGDTTVERVADTVGYASQSAFAHAFRRTFGVSPGASARS